MKPIQCTAQCRPNVVPTLASILLSASAIGAAVPRGGEASMRPGPNIARGKRATFDIAPDLPSCTDADDAKQLTDGRYGDGCSPSAAGTVGWRRRRRPVQITLDLRKEEPIAGVSFRTSGGQSGTYWPNAIFVLVSDDGEAFHHAGDLLTLSYRHELPPVSGAHAYRTDRLRAHGRCVRFAVCAPYNPPEPGHSPRS